jgi:hypothetical protein
VRRVIACLEEAIVGASPFAFAYLLRPKFLSAWVEVGVPFAGLAVASFFGKASLWRTVEVSWDREGLNYRKGDKVLHLPWSEYAGHRLTRDVPRRLKVLRISGKPLIIDTFPLTEDQRAMLYTELSARLSRRCRTSA